jgi:hypothetical protein
VYGSLMHSKIVGLEGKKNWVLARKNLTLWLAH